MKAIQEVFTAVREAEKQHPAFVSTDHEALAVLTEEVGEVAKALNDQHAAHMRQEIAQVAAVCIRWLDMTQPVIDCRLTAQEVAAVSGAGLQGRMGE